jgi:hypothetical protein
LRTNPLAWSLSAAVLVISSAALPARGAQESWIALGLPSIADSSSAGPSFPILEQGSHLLTLPGEEPEIRERAQAPAIGIASLLGLIQDDLTRRRLPLKLLPNAPPILVRGDPASLELVRGAVGELDQIGRALQVEVRAWWIDGRVDLPVHPDAGAVRAALAKASAIGARTLRSGAVAELGMRDVASYLAGYSVEVATDAGVADPMIGRIVTGRTLHLRPCRIRGGRQVHLEGFLDVARLASLEEFDCGTPDLGAMQVPTVDAVQVAFGGVVDSGGALAVTLENVSGVTGTLVVEASAAVDPTGLATWRAVDLALLETSVSALPLPQPGAGVDAPSQEELGVLRQPLTSATLAQVADEASRGGKDRQRPLSAWTPGLLVASAGDPCWSEVDALVAAAEKERALSYEIVVERGAGRVRLPSTEGLALRVLVARERTMLVDYDVHVAQESWMPSPEVEHVLDGWLVQGRCSAGGLACRAWIASTPESRRLEREQIGVGSMDLVRRNLRTAEARVTSGSAQEVFSQGEEPAQRETPSQAQGSVAAPSAGRLKVVLQGGRP